MEEFRNWKKLIGHDGKYIKYLSQHTINWSLARVIYSVHDRLDLGSQTYMIISSRFLLQDRLDLERSCSQI